MSLPLRHALIALAVVFVISFAGMAAGAGSISVLLALILGAFTWYGLSNLANNRRTKEVPAADRDRALAALPPAGAGLVYVYREGFMGKALGFDLVLDNQSVAQLKSPRFTRLIVAPGQHTLAAGPKGFAGSQNKAAALSFAIVAGETIVYALVVQRGMVQNTVTLNREPDPRAALAKCSLMTMVQPEIDESSFANSSKQD